MKKYLAFCIAIIFVAVTFASCGITTRPNDETTSTTKSNELDSSDLPTVTDENGEAVEYSVEEKTESSETATDENGEEIQNPYFSVGSLDEINKEAGTSIKKPTGIKIANEEFDVNDSYSPKIACYTFAVDGKDYEIWASKTTDSFLMGIYLDDGTQVGENLSENEALKPTEFSEGFCVARWFSDGVQYDLFAQNVSLEEFKTVYKAVK